MDLSSCCSFRPVCYGHRMVSFDLICYWFGWEVASEKKSGQVRGRSSLPPLPPPPLLFQFYLLELYIHIYRRTFYFPFYAFCLFFSCVVPVLFFYFPFYFPTPGRAHSTRFSFQFVSFFLFCPQVLRFFFFSTSTPSPSRVRASGDQRCEGAARAQGVSGGHASRGAPRFRR